MKGRIVRRWLLLCGSLVVALVAAEAALRAHYLLAWRGSVEDLHASGPIPETGRDVQLGRMLRPSPNPLLVYELKPDLDVRFKRARVRTSPAGLREQPHPEVKPARTVRVVGIGDSTMFGWGVAESERYMDRLERRLNAEYGGEWQTIVTAVPGYNLVMEVESLMVTGRRYAPDLIVYGWNPNDLCLPDFLLPKRDVWAPVSFLVEYARGLEARSPGLLPRARLTRSRCQGDDLPERHSRLAGYHAFGSALERLAAFGVDTGTPIVVVADFQPGFEDHMATVLPEPLLYCDPVDRMAAIPLEARTLGRRDPHPNERGHALIADALFEQLGAAGVWHQLMMNPPSPSEDVSSTGATS